MMDSSAIPTQFPLVMSPSTTTSAASAGTGDNGDNNRPAIADSQGLDRWSQRPQVALVALVAGALVLSGCASTSPASNPSSSSSAGVTTSGAARVKAEFVHPEKFMDLQLGGQTPEASRPQVLSRFQRLLQREAVGRIPAGSVLEVRFTEVDQAGWIPPFNLHEVRVITEIRPARLELEYRTIPAAKSGEVNDPPFRKVVLSSAGEYRTAVHSSSDPLAIELQLLRDWVRRLGTGS